MKKALFALGVVALTLYASLSFATNAGDFAGAVAIGTGYAGTVSSPTNGLVVQGNVGIGTSSPGASLDVAGSIRSSNSFTVNNVAGTYRTYVIQSSGLNRWSLGSDGTTESGSNAGSNFYIQAWTDAGSGSYVPVYISRSTGNIGIQNSSPAYMLHVGSSPISGIVMELQNSSGACTYNPGASSVTVSCSSDERLKSDIQDTSGALAWINDMRIRDFTVKATGEQRTGVIAQEVAVSHPEMVHENADGLYSVDEPNPWVLVKAFQEQQAEIADLKAEVEKLKQH